VTTQAWLAAPSPLPFEAEEVHVWVASLDVDDDELGFRAAVLDDHERARARRMTREIAWRRFIAGRGLLRLLLGCYLDTPPAQVPLTQTPKGKPAVAEPGADVRFNLSHSEGILVCGVTRGREIGADVERIRADISVEELAKRFFAPAEAADLLARPISERRLAFFRAWTRKEAYIKGRGDGLAWPLDGFEVSTGPDAALVVDRNAPEAPNHWWLTEVIPESEYLGAVAVEGPVCPLRLWRWPASRTLPRLLCQHDSDSRTAPVRSRP
jgi:4'-phosphopantetheinyl transferase